MLFSGVQKLTLLDFPEHTACILFTPGCNLRCGFCHNPEFVLPKKLAEIAGSFIPDSTVLNFLVERKKFLDGVVITGGEPTIVRELPQFIAKVKELGYAVKLDTNGNRPEVLEDLLEQKLLDYVAMDVKTMPEEYGRLVGPGVKKENIIESIELLKATHVPYEFRTTLIKEVHTPAILKRMAKLLQGGERLYLQAFRPATTLDPLYERYHPFSPQEMDAIATLFQGSLQEVGVRV